MATNTVPSTADDKAQAGNLAWTMRQAQRRTDRFIRLFHRAKETAVKQRWFDLAVRHDEIAADCARQLREVLPKTPGVSAR